MENNITISDRLNYNWMVDMYEVGHEMMISQTPNSLGEHIVLYGEGASKCISHNTWLAFQAFKKRIHSKN